MTPVSWRPGSAARARGPMRAPATTAATRVSVMLAPPPGPGVRTRGRYVPGQGPDGAGRHRPAGDRALGRCGAGSGGAEADAAATLGAGRHVAERRDGDEHAPTLVVGQLEDVAARAGGLDGGQQLL